MSHNLFIAYDLISPGQDYDRIMDAIKSVGKWHQFQQSLFYVNTQQTPIEVFAFVKSHMDTNDKLCVIDAESAIVTTWDRPPIDAINAIWDSA